MIDENTPEEEKNEKYMELGKERTLKMMQKADEKNPDGPSLVSVWDKEVSDKFRLVDMGLTFIAMKEYVDRMRDPQALLGTDKDDLEPELTKAAIRIVKENADFLLDVQGDDGSFCKSLHYLKHIS